MRRVLETPAHALFARVSSRRNVLRAATEALHRELDARFTPADFVERGLYAQFLQRTARALLPLEQSLHGSAIAERFGDWDRRRRSEALAYDLRQLGLEPAHHSVVSERQLLCAESFGVLYVLEGSRLGSKVLLSHVQASEDLTLRSATRYLSANDATLWRGFLSALEDEHLVLDEGELVKGARFAFQCYLRAYSSIE